LAALLDGREAGEAWGLVTSGRIPPEVSARWARSGVTDRSADWARKASRVDLAALLAAHDAAGIRLLVAGHPHWPVRLLSDPEPPLILCVRGDLMALGRPTCGVVGTRSCTPDGRRVAHLLGRELAEAGVTVVSGLALGVDAAAHRGCLAAIDADPSCGPPVGVVAGGLDNVYPPSHVDLYAAVAGSGALLSEVPLGIRPERWRFPARNRVIAALSDVVVVVETAERGGSLHTVEAALDRDRIVGAVPGPVLSVTSKGTNGLLADGALVVREAADVLMALGLVSGRRGSRGDGGRPAAAVAAELGEAAVAVYGAVGSSGTPLEHVVAESGLGLGDALHALQQLAAAGLIEDCVGLWSRVGV